MAFRLYEENDHVAAYLQYRVTPCELIQTIMEFMAPMVRSKFNLAVDVGCGNGKGTILLAPFFNQVVGTDISPAQLKVAQSNNLCQNVSYRQCPAEDLPFESGQVDLITAMTAAHWFDHPRFLKEADRILKPNGCLALLSNTMDMELEYGDTTTALNNICEEFYAALVPFKNPYLGTSSSKIYLEMFDSCSYPEKYWNGCQKIHRNVTVNHFIGLVETFTSYQKLKHQDAAEAKRLSDDVRKKLLGAMQVSSPDTELTMVVKYFYMLARKP
ncbi:putative methyltransferase DDB_G0268948 [Corythoichthys intestinalis]|uniref:putative methyltransferase DDB_G0268948 n=1 Tax=Corythoichthys intestinalis TaxID=161448 RepID=UPI0025A63CC0|nr:putative methyltransferase DDB_G0268948 [Corythoichthys intestinalis]XP_061801995.1 putative methyltransferase DDB_G0268948 [Nerophis lumbriciformis]